MRGLRQLVQGQSTQKETQQDLLAILRSIYADGLAQIPEIIGRAIMNHEKTPERESA